jgi:hypothetical protein
MQHTLYCPPRIREEKNCFREASQGQPALFNFYFILHCIKKLSTIFKIDLSQPVGKWGVWPLKDKTHNNGYSKNIIDSNAKSLRLKSNLEKDFAAAASFCEASSQAQIFVLGWPRNFVESESFLR